MARAPLDDKAGAGELPAVVREIARRLAHEPVVVELEDASGRVMATKGRLRSDGPGVALVTDDGQRFDLMSGYAIRRFL